MMVPTLTMLGRSWCPWSREAGMVVEAVATGAIMSRGLFAGPPAPLADPSCSGRRCAAYSRWRGPTRDARHRRAGAGPAEVHHGHGLHAVGPPVLGEPGDPPDDGALPVGSPADAPPGRPMAAGPDRRAAGCHGGGGDRHGVRSRGVRRHAAQ